MSTVESVTTTDSSSLSADYMQLLVAQLQNQNPLEPMDNNEMTAQLTSLSQLSQLESMNTSFSSMLENSQLNYAQSLVGKEVSFYDYNEEQTMIGTVYEVINSSDDGIQLVAGDYLINLDEVMSIGETSLLEETDSTDSTDTTEDDSDS